MASVSDLLRSKRPVLHTIPSHLTVLDATRVMNDHKIGAVIVTRDDRIVGIFTERDVLHRVVAEERPPSRVTVEDVMTTDVMCCFPESSLDEVRGVMKNRRIRHLPVVEQGGKVLGMISIGDLNAYESSDLEMTIHNLHDYIYGRV